MGTTSAPTERICAIVLIGACKMPIVYRSYPSTSNLLKMDFPNRQHLVAIGTYFAKERLVDTNGDPRRLTWMNDRYNLTPWIVGSDPSGIEPGLTRTINVRVVPRLRIEGGITESGYSPQPHCRGNSFDTSYQPFSTILSSTNRLGPIPLLPRTSSWCGEQWSGTSLGDGVAHWRMGSSIS